MIAIETSRLTAATMVASESIDCPGAPWSCSAASRSGHRAPQRQAREHRDGEPRHQHDRPDEQQRDRQVAEERQAVDRRRGGERRAAGDHGEARPGRPEPLEQPLLVARLQRRRGLRARRFERRCQARQERDDHAEREEHQPPSRARTAAPAACRGNSPPRDRRRPRRGSPPPATKPSDEPEGRADRAEKQRFAEQRPDELTALHPEHAEQRELRAPAHHRERLGREHEQPAGEERDEREHVQVHAIGARDVRRALEPGRRTLDEDAGGQLGREPRAERLDVDAGPQPQVEAVDAAGAVERGLHAGDVGDPEARAVGPGEAGDPEARLAEPDLQRDRIALLHAQPLRRGRAEEDRVGTQRVEGVGDRGREEVGLHEPRPEDVEPDERGASPPGRQAATSASIAGLATATSGSRARRG